MGMRCVAVNCHAARLPWSTFAAPIEISLQLSQSCSSFIFDMAHFARRTLLAGCSSSKRGVWKSTNPQMDARTRNL